MISVELLVIIHTRLQQIPGNFDELFGGMNIIFCGDLRQLPPVMATPIYKRCKTFGNEILWQGLEYYTLKKIIRQKDEIFRIF